MQTMTQTPHSGELLILSGSLIQQKSVKGLHEDEMIREHHSSNLT